jgi:hypothetical protein
MSPEDLKICKENNICKFHVSGGNSKFEGSYKWKHATPDERKKIGLSFSAASSKSEAQEGSEEALISELLDGVREITAAGPVANRGGAFHNQFGIGHFAVSAEEFARLSSEEERMIAEEVVGNQVEEDVPKEAGEVIEKEELEIVKVSGNGSCLFNAIEVHVKIDPKQLRQMVADAVVPNAEVKYNNVTLREWIFDEEGMTPEKYAADMREGKWGGQTELHLLAQSLKTPITVYAQPEKGVFTLQHTFKPVSGGNDSAEPIRVLFGNQHYDALVKKAERERKTAGMERPTCETEVAAAGSAAEQHEEEVKSVLEMLLIKTEQAEAGEYRAECNCMLDEAVAELMTDVGLTAVSEDSEEGWTTVKPKSRGKKTRRERTGLAKEGAQKREVVPMSTGLMLLVEKGSEGYDSSTEMEDADALCSLSTDVKHAHDSMGRIIVEDGMQRLIPVMPRMTGECAIPVEEINAREKRRKKDERAQAAAAKSKAKARTEKNRQARRAAQSRREQCLTSSRRSVVSV